jgi:hypothetical protein
MWTFFSQRLRRWVLFAIAWPVARLLVRRLARAADHGNWFGWCPRTAGPRRSPQRCRSIHPGRAPHHRRRRQPGHAGTGTGRWRRWPQCSSGQERNQRHLPERAALPGSPAPVHLRRARPRPSRGPTGQRRSGLMPQHPAGGQPTRRHRDPGRSRHRQRVRHRPAVRSRLPGLARHRVSSSPRGGEARGKPVVAQSDDTRPPWRRPTYEHRESGGVSEPGTYTSWNWS